MPPRQWGARAAATALHRQGRCAASRAAPRRQKRDFWPGHPTPLRRRQDAPRLAQPVPASGFRAWLPAVEQPAADSDWSLRAGRHRCTAGAAPPVRKGLGRAVWCRQEAWRAARVVGGGGRGPRGWWSTSLRRRPSRRAEQRIIVARRPDRATRCRWLARQKVSQQRGSRTAGRRRLIAERTAAVQRLRGPIPAGGLCFPSVTSSR